MSKIMDRYVLGARVAPIIIVSLMLFLAASAWIPFREWPTKLLGGSAVLIIVAFVLAQVARNAGKKIEGALWLSWGGPPTTQLLRHRDQTIAAGSKLLLHQRLIALGIVKGMPSSIEEAAEPARADDIYQTCGDWLRRKALELKNKPPFDIVHSENIMYGFQRNMLGIKPYGVAVFVLSFALTIMSFGFGRSPYIELIALVMLGVYLWFGVSSAAVKKAAYDYSQRLLDATQSLEPVKPQSSASRRGKSEKAQ